MADSNACGTLSREQEDAVMGARLRMRDALDDLVDADRYWSALGTIEDIEELEFAFPALFGPDGYYQDVLSVFREGC